jgi:hypothetical protein
MHAYITFCIGFIKESEKVKQCMWFYELDYVLVMWLNYDEAEFLV